MERWPVTPPYAGPDSQLALLDEQGRTHEHGTDTEREAAAALNARTLRRAVLAALREYPAGLTDDEGAQILGWSDRLKFGRRRQELRDAQLVEDTGIRRKNITTGRNAIVWRAVAEAPPLSMTASPRWSS